MDPPACSRRAFLAGGAGLALTALSAGPAAALASASRAGTRQPIAPLVLSSDLFASPDPQRFAFAIARGARFASVGRAQVAFAPPGSREAPILDTNLYQDGLPRGRGIYVVDATFPTAGVWTGFAITRGRRVRFAVQVRPAARAPLAGAPAPQSPSPTTTDPMGVNPLCTRRPACPLHEVSLADVIGRGVPVAVMFATPALCKTAYCGPVLDSLLEVMDPYRDRVRMVHVEIYESNRGATLAPTVEAWALPSEPWFYTIDGAGIVRGRLDSAFATNEIKAALDAIVA